MKMSDQNVIGDVRNAKVSVDRQFKTIKELGVHLRAIEQAYQARGGEYGSVPSQKPDWVRKLIEAAADEPGQGFLNDVRPARGK
jgi:hypothetical protein